MKLESKTFLFAILAGLLLLLRAAGVTGTRPQGENRSSDKAPEAPILAVPLKSFKVQNANMAEALLALRSSDVKYVVIGFERIPHHEGEKGGPISLAVTDTNLGEVVQRLCQADSRYEYQVVDGSMIEIRPKGAAKDPNDLLNIKVRDYKVDANILAAAAIEGVNEDVPELRDFLYRKQLEWVKETGIYPGVPGSMMSGNMLPPRLTLDLHNVTVLQILDAIAIKSVQMFKEGPDYDARGMPLKMAPVGWRYDFVINPNAPTGLGGYPKWTEF